MECSGTLANTRASVTSYSCAFGIAKGLPVALVQTLLLKAAIQSQSPAAPDLPTRVFGHGPHRGVNWPDPFNGLIYRSGGLVV